MLTSAEYQQLRDEIDYLHTELAHEHSAYVEMAKQLAQARVGRNEWFQQYNRLNNRLSSELAQARAWSAAWKERATFYRELCSEPDETELYIIDNLRAELAQERADAGATVAWLQTELSQAHLETKQWRASAESNALSWKRADTERGWLKDELSQARTNSAEWQRQCEAARSAAFDGRLSRDTLHEELAQVRADAGATVAWLRTELGLARAELSNGHNTLTSQGAPVVDKHDTLYSITGRVMQLVKQLRTDIERKDVALSKISHGGWKMFENGQARIIARAALSPLPDERKE